MSITFSDLIRAFKACQKNKNGQWGYWKFDFDRHQNLSQLWQELRRKTWQPSPHKVFVVTEPKPREVWAALFRDRVVHHWVYQKLWPVFRKKFIPSSYACIPHKGTLRASFDLKGALVSRGYKRGYYLKMDVKNFFNRIHKPTLWQILLPYIKTDPVLYDVVKKLLFTDIRCQAIRVSPKDVMALVPEYKSLFTQESDRGLPIGNLTSQFFANVYLNELDHFVYSLGYNKTSYFRYMDDWVLLNEDKKQLQRDHDLIVQFLQNKLLLEVAHDKTVLAPLSHSLDFVGYVHHKGAMKLRRRTRRKWWQSLSVLGFKSGIRKEVWCKQRGRGLQQVTLEKMVKDCLLKCRALPLLWRQRWASYLGRFCHSSEYTKRLRELLSCCSGERLRNKGYTPF